MRFRVLLRLLAVTLIAAAPPLVAGAQSLFDRLVMPGPLIEGHARLESNCSNCHEAFSKGAQNALCVSCHKEIAADLAQRSGLHGQRPDVVKADCKHCHSDHQGRAADIVQFDRDTFDHVATRFSLRGAHKTLDCNGCHQANVKFRKAPQRCAQCHKKDEPHKGRLGEACESCHGEESWRTVKSFDHARTRFALTGPHAKVACAVCHTEERYKGVSTTCGVCHQIQDVHNGRYGTKCETCHQTAQWTQIRFDHDRQTKFALRGNHAKAKCDSCHTGDLYRDKLPTTCVSCHKKDEPHKGQLGANCERCHNESGWRQKVAFDHDLTHFPLIGKHALVACESCHRTPSFKDTPTRCADCHKDSYHEGRLGPNCATCHNPNGWKFWRFDHAKTRFPLTGAHQGLNCHLCHRNKTGISFMSGTTCYSCHAADDTHQGKFGAVCDKCHTTTSFRGAGIR